MYTNDFDRRNRELVSILKKRGIIKSKLVEKAFLTVPRHLFVPKEYIDNAYDDTPLPTLKGQTISQPSIVALMLEELDLRPNQKVLEIGAGSGWNASLIANIVKPGKVITVEIDKDVAEFAKNNIMKTGIDNVIIIEGDGSLGYEKEAPYDRIIITASCKDVPEPLFQQLKNGGKLIAPVGDVYSQILTLFEKNKKIKAKEILPCIFVPLRGKYGIV
jgi:protein-L-isoaspartate(D-aspartate) O-methyltransferase